MGVKISTYVCVVLFGSTSWLSTNSIWMELPLLTDKLPEGWSLPSYLAVIVQIGCIGPLIYSIIHKCSKVPLSATFIILTLLLFCCMCTALTALFWSQTAFIFGQQRSVALMILVFGMALVNATSNVLFMPYMATFHASYLTAYFVGMGVSALFPSIVSLIQGSGSDCIVVNGTSVSTASALRFGISEYNFIMLAWLIIATAAFVLLTRFKSSTSRDESPASTRPDIATTTAASVDESSPLSVSESTPLSRYEGMMGVDRNALGLKRIRYPLLLLLMAVVNAQMNGVIPSVQSYASLPYSQATYHLGLTLSNVVSPVVCFLPLLIKVSGLPVLALFTVASSALTGVIIAFAAMSPTPPLQNSVWGTVLIVAITVCALALNSFLRTVLATALSEDTADSETRLFWGGVFIQVGSFLGSCIMFPLVNIFRLFVSAPTCPQ